MNIHDFEAPPYPDLPNERWDNVWDRQQELEQHYLDIERKNGYMVPDLNMPLENPYVQDCIKHSAWCVMEELAEMREAYGYASDSSHWREEFADALHFFMAIHVRYHLTPFPALFGPEMPTDAFDASDLQVEFSTSLGLMCNTLKNKRWKTSHHPVDVNKFMMHLRTATRKFHLMWIALNRQWSLSRDAQFTTQCGKLLYELYFRKSEVNQFRQRSGY